MKINSIYEKFELANNAVFIIISNVNAGMLKSAILSFFFFIPFSTL